VIEILIRPEHERVGAREISHGLGEGVVMALQMDLGCLLLARDLLLEERAQNDRGSTRVLELLDGVEIVG
jgi:hypothetical protein